MVDIEITHYAERDADGNRGAATEGPTLTGCGVAPTDTADTQERATDGVYERLTVYCPDPDADVRPTSSASYNGATYQVDGATQRWTNMFTGTRPGCTFDISRKVG